MRHRPFNPNSLRLGSEFYSVLENICQRYQPAGTIPGHIAIVPLPDWEERNLMERSWIRLTLVTTSLCALYRWCYERQKHCGFFGRAVAVSSWSHYNPTCLILGKTDRTISRLLLQYSGESLEFDEDMETSRPTLANKSLNTIFHGRTQSTGRRQQTLIKQLFPIASRISRYVDAIEIY
jgi:hypothetical protein